MTNKTPQLSHLLALSLSIAAPAAAHGYVQGIVAEGQFYQGYRPSFQYLSSPPQIAGWSDPLNIDNGYISNYSSPDIICHLGATPGQAYATVKAGDTVTLQWTDWPIGHLGPVLTYLANCQGNCTNVTKTELLFNKIDAVGLVQSSPEPGIWGASELIANNNSWTVTIPAQIAPGNYVLRNEIIALQEAQTFGRAQNYPQCINLEVTGNGTNSLQSGTLGTELYNAADPGLYIDIYQVLSNYTIPGPPLLAGLSSNATMTTAPFANSTSVTAAGVFITTSSVSTSTSATTLMTVTTSSTTLTSITTSSSSLSTATTSSTISTSSSSTSSSTSSSSTASTLSTTSSTSSSTSSTSSSTSSSTTSSSASSTTTTASTTSSTSGTSSTISSSSSTTTTASELLFAIQPATITLDLVDGAAPTATALTLNGTFLVNGTTTSVTVVRALVTGSPGTTGTGTGYPFYNTTATSYTYVFPALTPTTTSDSPSMTSLATLSTTSYSTVLVFSDVPFTTAIEKRRHQRDFVQAPFVEVEGDQRRRGY